MVFGLRTDRNQPADYLTFNIDFELGVTVGPAGWDLEEAKSVPGTLEVSKHHFPVYEIPSLPLTDTGIEHMAFTERKE